MFFIFSCATATFWLHKDPWQHKEQANGLESNEIIVVASFFKKSFIITAAIILWMLQGFISEGIWQ